MNRWTSFIVAGSVLLLDIVSWSSSSGQTSPALSEKQFSKPDLFISTAVVRLNDVMGQLPNADNWSLFLAAQTNPVAAFLDPRSGTPVNIVTSTPVIPGSGKGNTLALADLENALGTPVPQVTASVVGELVRQYVVGNQGVFAITIDQLGTTKAAQVTDYLWQVSIPQVVGDIPVRDARLLGTLNHGNLVAIGTERWGNVTIDPHPSVSSDEAMRLGFQYDNFQFSYSTDGTNFTNISGALINTQSEHTGLEYPFGTAGLSGSIYIRVEDTCQSPPVCSGPGTSCASPCSDTTQNTVYVDQLYIRAQE
jgi:hypothetical protein